jgi:hypothetical protein
MATKEMERLMKCMAPTVLIQLRPEDPENAVPPTGARPALEGQIGEQGESLGLGQNGIEPTAGPTQVERAKRV